MNKPSALPPPAQAQVVFMPSGRRGNFARGTSILEAARSLGVDIDSVCGGRALCGRCQVRPIDCTGPAPGQQGVSLREPISVVDESERRYRQRRPMKEDLRLSCSTRIEGDLVVDVPADSQVHRQLVRKGVEAYPIVINPAVQLRFIEVAEPDMEHPSGDWQRIEAALQAQWGLLGIRCDPAVMSSVQRALRSGNWRITVALADAVTVVAVWPGIHDRVLGMAIDIGSTTVAAQLCDLTSGVVLASDGLMNPQIRYGEDLMSRVSWAMMNPDRWQEMTAAVRDAVNALTVELARQAGVPATDILELTVVANPVMHHLFLGINPVELGSAPFALATDGAVCRRADTLALVASPGARVYLLPCIAGHVGADMAGVLLAERPDLTPDVTLVVDVGTNAEIVLGNQDRLVACSSPTGPAFEGAQISSGQRATAGAIERVRIDPVTFEPRFKVIGCELWSNEANFEQQTAATGIRGICGSGIIDVVSQLYLVGLLRPDGVIDGDKAACTNRLVPDGRTFSYRLHGQAENAMLITQNDVRAIQLAKAALNAGVKLLMRRLGVKRVDRIRLAGAFGSHIDVVQAMVLGMLPDCAVDQVSAAGNAAGTGARIALLDKTSRDLIERLVRRVEKIETAVEPMFQEFFVQAMSIPHGTDSYPLLRSAIAMPVATAGQRIGRRRRPRPAPGREPSKIPFGQ